MNELTKAANRAVLGSARIQLQSAAHLAKRDGSALEGGSGRGDGVRIHTEPADEVAGMTAKTTNEER